MSLEQAINDHAAAINDHAAAIRELAAAFIQSANARNDASAALEKAYAEATVAGGESKESVKPNTAREAINEALAAAKGGRNKGDKQADADLEQAVSKVEADAKKNAGAAGTATSTAGGTAGPAEEQGGTDQAEPLSYEKDVKPVLVKLAGAKGKDELTKLVKSFGVGKATELSAEQLPRVLEQATKLLAA